MSTWIVVGHDLDEEEGVYRLEVAQPVTDTVTPMVEKTTEREMPRPLDEDGDPIGDPIMETIVEVVPGDPEEVLTGYTGHRDFLFAADDDLWFASGERIPLEDAAARQRELVKEALAVIDAEQAEAERRAAARTELPGVGEAL